MTIEGDIRTPEIHNDKFAALLTQYARRRDLRTFLDIGASDGRGSTAAFVEGLKDRPPEDNVQLCALEFRKNRYEFLCELYKGLTFVLPYNLSSVPSSAYPTREDVLDFCRTFEGNDPGMAGSLVDHKAEIELVVNSGIDGEGILAIQEDLGIRYFDFVLIDGNHWTGEQELYRVIGAKVIALDDIRSYKNFTSARLLQVHPLYKLAHLDVNLRYGFAIFERK